MRSAALRGRHPRGPSPRPSRTPRQRTSRRRATSRLPTRLRMIWAYDSGPDRPRPGSRQPAGAPGGPRLASATSFSRYSLASAGETSKSACPSRRKARTAWALSASAVAARRHERPCLRSTHPDARCAEPHAHRAADERGRRRRGPRDRRRIADLNGQGPHSQRDLLRGRPIAVASTKPSQTHPSPIQLALAEPIAEDGGAQLLLGRNIGPRRDGDDDLHERRSYQTVGDRRPRGPGDTERHSR
jgi:hypothetical protein